MFFHLPDHHHLIKLHFFGLKIWGRWDDFTELLTRFCPKNEYENFWRKSKNEMEVSLLTVEHLVHPAFTRWALHLAELLCHRESRLPLSAFQAVQHEQCAPGVDERMPFSQVICSPDLPFKATEGACMFSVRLGQEQVTGTFLSRMFVHPCFTVLFCLFFSDLKLLLQ